MYVSAVGLCGGCLATARWTTQSDQRVCGKSWVDHETATATVFFGNFEEASYTVSFKYEYTFWPQGGALLWYISSISVHGQLYTFYSNLFSTLSYQIHTYNTPYNPQRKQ